MLFDASWCYGRPWEVTGWVGPGLGMSLLLAGRASRDGQCARLPTKGASCYRPLIQEVVHVLLQPVLCLLLLALLTRRLIPC